MTKWVCAVCGWTVEQENQPEICPLCKATKFNKMDAEAGFACEHHVGDGVVEDVKTSGDSDIIPVEILHCRVFCHGRTFCLTRRNTDFE